MHPRTLLALLVAFSGTRWLCAEHPPERPRLIVLTDIGGDPDDTQSLIRLMTYANEFEIEGLIASAAGVPGELKESITRPDLIRQVVAAYGDVHANLQRHDGRFPSPEQLLAVVCSGNPHRGLNAIGEAHDTDGSRRIIQTVDRPGDRPVNVAIWGGQTDLAQALWRVRNDRSPAELRAFLARLRVYDIADQDGIQPWIAETFPELFYVLAHAPRGMDKRLGAFRGMYLGGDESLTSREWIDRHVRTRHGPLGALYPMQTFTRPNPHGALKEGDTPSWFYFLPRGLNDPAHPEWGSWGGRFTSTDGRLYRDAADAIGDTTDPRAAVWRWRPAFQNDFQARLDWCVKPPEDANHAPAARLRGHPGSEVLAVAARAGDVVSFDASASTDPDGDDLSFQWWIYAEAGRGARSNILDSTIPAQATLRLDGAAVDSQVHLILEVTDDGEPPLTAYRRIVIDSR